MMNRLHIRRTAVRLVAERLFAVLLLLCGGTGMQAEVRVVTQPDGLAPALQGSKEGDIVLVAGGVYTGGFTVPAGVALYGGFSAGQLSEVPAEADVPGLLGQRGTDGGTWKFKHPTILSGDTNGNDRITVPSDMFGGGGRTENVPHVLSVAGGGNKDLPTVVDGLVVHGGNAWTGNDLDGGGICVTGNSGYVTVSRCFLYDNAAKGQGGAIYVPDGVRATLYDLMVMNNAAGSQQREGMLGGGVYLGNGLMYNCVVANNLNGGVRMGAKAYVTGCTVVRNTVAGVGFPETVDKELSGLTHTVLWGNSEPMPGAVPDGLVHAHCAYKGAGQGHVDLSDNNSEMLKSPFFVRPSDKIQYDMNYAPQDDGAVEDFAYPLRDWSIDRTSMLIVDEELSGVPEFPQGAFAEGGAFAANTDLAGRPRRNTKGGQPVMDIGAYQYPVASIIVRVDNRNSVTNGKGETWADAMTDLQAAIDRVALQGGGEVWVKGNGPDHPYRPTTLIYSDRLSTNYLAFIMRDGVSVYGGFRGTEESLQQRFENQLAETGNKFPKETASTIPWEFGAAETVLQGATAVEGGSEGIFTLHAAQVNGDAPAAAPDMATKASSYHVVWFAPLPQKDAAADAPVGAFTQTTVLDGVTIKHGNAVSSARGREQRGGGVYMVGNAVLSNCVVTECMAADGGGAVYMENGGQVRSCMIHRNGVVNDDAAVVARGGGVYMLGEGLVMRSMLSNNLADEGGGVFVQPGEGTPDGYQILTTNVITNNTARVNGGGVYLNRGGVLQQSTVAMNYCTAARTLMTGNVYNGETGGVYINEKGVVLNTVLWNNMAKANKRGLFALNPAAGKVKVWGATMAEKSLINWNGIDQKKVMALNRANTSESASDVAGSEVYYPNFWDNPQQSVMPKIPGVYEVVNEDGSTYNNYYWEVSNGSSFHNRGLSQEEAPDEVMLDAQIDLAGNTYPVVPDLGAYVAVRADLHIQNITVDGEKRGVVFVDPACTDATHSGADWDHAAYSLNEAIEALGNYRNSPAYEDDGSPKLEVWMKEGTQVPSANVQNTDPRTATFELRTGITLRGGFPATLTKATAGADGGWSQRNPSLYHTVLDGNIGDEALLGDNVYHVVTFGADVKEAELDGFHIVNGYAGGLASVLEGGGVMGRKGAHVRLRNCVLENNAAEKGAAIYAREAQAVTLVNTVMNNNGHEGKEEAGHADDAYLISVPVNGQTTASFCTFANNHTQQVFSQQDGVDVSNSLFINSGRDAAAESGGNTVNDQVTAEALQGSFENPTKDSEVHVGFNNYKGGYTSFRPIDRMNAHGLDIVNTAGDKGGVETDLALNGRDLGGKPDRGAYEADLPEAGRIIYVRQGGNGDGLSWDEAMGNINEAVTKAVAYNEKLTSEERANPAKRAQVWVAAGRYTGYSSSQGQQQYDYNSFVIQDGVDVLGAFPAGGNPGPDERIPLLSSKVKAQQTNVAAYETILEASSQCRVLGQLYEYNPFKGGYKSFVHETTWDGFTLTEGSLDALKIGTPNRNGGAGAAIYTNVILKNCVVTDNTITNSDKDERANARGGGVYCDEGTIVNCYLINNEMTTERQAGAYYGGGAYLYRGTMYNCVVANNSIKSLYADGAALFLETASFYNNTVVNNTATSTGSGGGSEARCIGGIAVWKDGVLDIYNCIIAGNNGYKPNTSNWIEGNKNIGVQSGTINVYNSLFDTSVKNLNKDGRYIYFYDALNYAEAGSGLQWEDIFVSVDENDFFNSDYRLNGQHASTVNMGLNIIEKTDGQTINLFEYTDMDYTDRIKDCTIDAGAFEYTTQNVLPSVAGGIASFYVTQNGSQKADASTPENAACATKLQRVLNAAGRYKAGEGKDQRVVVKVAAIPLSVAGGTVTYGGAYQPNDNDEGRLDKDDEQSATFQIPYGVEVWGGYREFDDQGKELADDRIFVEDNRNPYEYKTVLSAERVNYKKDGTPSVYGYHTVTFLDKEDGQADARTVLDGLYLQDGRALSQAGQLEGELNMNTVGGAAIVPAYVHIRNCVVAGNQAANLGGGLYVQPGGLVSGTLVYDNTAVEGSGIYAAANDQNLDDDAAERPRIISSTIGRNGTEGSDAASLYFGIGTTVVNTTVWGSRTGVNVRGNADVTFKDGRLCEAAGADSTDHLFYPFSNCYVEGTEVLPGDFQNGVMTSDAETYFYYDTDNDYRLRAYSPLINSGMPKGFYAKLVDGFGLSTEDLRMGSESARYGESDNLAYKDNVDVGAFAIPYGGMNYRSLGDNYYRKLYVSTAGYAAGGDIGKGDNMDGLGSNSNEPSHSLHQLISYINGVRATNPDADDTTFEIFMDGGIYTPRGTASGLDADMRENSFLIPDNVKVYGGFNFANLNAANKVYDQSTEAKEVLAVRERADANTNSIIEPWEFANETVLSGVYNSAEGIKYVYHVVTAKGGNAAKGITLDGVSIRNGQAAGTDLNDARSKGGGLYAENLPVTIANASFLENKGGRGAAIYGTGTATRLVLSGVNISGNEAREIPADTGNEGSGYGAGVYLAEKARLEAYNTLWANNEATTGAAVAVNNGNGNSSEVYLVNNTLVRNKAVSTLISAARSSSIKVYNSILWGNDVNKLYAVPESVDVQHSGSDAEDFSKEHGNILLNRENNTLTGPYFNSPTTEAGAAGYMPEADWGLRTLSAVVDAGTTDLYRIYGDNNGITLPEDEYMRYADASQTWMKRVDYPAEKLADGTLNPRTWIDMGAYEYQYQGLSTGDILYVVEKEAPGSGNDGSSWEKATANLQGAISQLLSGNATSDNRHTVLYIASGDYRPVNDIAKNGFVVNKNPEAGAEAYNTVSLTVYGSRLKGSDRTARPQMGTADGQTVLYPNFDGQERIMTLAPNTTENPQKPVTIILSDLVFDGEGRTDITGLDVHSLIGGGTAENRVDGLYLNNCIFRDIKGEAAVRMGTPDAGVKRVVVNSLFHGNTVGVSGGNTQLVNSTFAQNTGLGAVLTGPDAKIANTVFWMNNGGAGQFTTEAEGHVTNSRWTGMTGEGWGEGNEALSDDNGDLNLGPKFRDPSQSDYSLTPGMKLLNQGDNENYEEVFAGINAVTENNKTDDGSTIANAHTVSGAYELASADRMKNGGDPAKIDVGAYEYNGMLRNVLYVDNQTSVLNGTGESWTSPMRDVQEALDLAAVAANDASGQQVGYVFMKGTGEPVAAMRLRVGTHVYGSMRGTEVAASGDDEAEKVLAQRPGLLEGQTRTVVRQVTSDAISGSYGIVDGIEVAGNTSAQAVNLQGKAMLRNVLIRDNVNPAVRLGDESVLYNALVRGNSGPEATVTGTGYVINSTVVDGTLGTPEGKQQNNLVVAGSDVFTKANISDENLRYQLSDGATGQLGTGGESVLEALKDVIDFATDRDILGNNRLFRGKGHGKVDLGCFETWNIADNADGGSYAVTDADNNYPHGKSVVYVGKGVELRLNQKDYNGQLFAPAHVLLKHQAGLWAGRYNGNVNKMSLDNVSVEREVPAHGNNLFSVPFKATAIALRGAGMYAYDGAARAAENKPGVAETASSYWKQEDGSTTVPMQGYLLENATDQPVTVRIDARGEGEGVTPVYTENASTPQVVALQQYNSNEWSSGAFTHKENMGWNLFGSPYLHAMNFEDMENGHMLYRLEDGGVSFRALPTYDEQTAAVTEGHIPSGDAVFTQTATLEPKEELTIVPRGQEIQKNGTSTRLAVYVAPAAAAPADRVELTAVAPAEAVTEYTPGSDAVKWPALSRNVPQIYARRSGNDYALLSAVSREADTELGVYVADAGQYELGIPADCNADDYETVVLKDAATGRAVDLKEGAYAFNTAQGGRLEGRFTLSFNRAGSGDAGIRIYGQDGRIVVEGLQPGNLIRVYDTVGRQYTTRVAQHAREELQGVPGHVTLVEVAAKGKTLKTGKVTVK